MDVVIVLLGLIGVSIFSWVMVVSSSTRRRFSKPGYVFWRLSKADRETAEGAGIAAWLVMALFFSMFTIVVLVLGIVNRFKS